MRSGAIAATILFRGRPKNPICRPKTVQLTWTILDLKAKDFSKDLLPDLWVDLYLEAWAYLQSGLDLY